MAEEEIEKALEKSEKIMKDKFQSGELKIDCSKTQKDSHALAEIKEKEFKRIQSAFGIDGDEYRPGGAFDFEQQEKQRLEQLYHKE